jgi:hypothetical protein
VNMKACLTSSSRHAPAAKENRAGGIWRISASNRDMVPTMYSIIAVKDDLDVWMRGISDGWNTVSRNARVVMWKRTVFHVWQD